MKLSKFFSSIKLTEIQKSNVYLIDSSGEDSRKIVQLISADFRVGYHVVGFRKTMFELFRVNLKKDEEIGQWSFFYGNPENECPSFFSDYEDEMLEKVCNSHRFKRLLKKEVSRQEARDAQ